MKQFDVTALSELLIDFTENGQSGQGNTVFEANPGGAPCNVLAMLKKLCRSCAFVGKVGDDMFGHLLRDVAAGAGICMDYLRFDKDVRTTLANGAVISFAPNLRAPLWDSLDGARAQIEYGLARCDVLKIVTMNWNL